MLEIGTGCGYQTAVLAALVVHIFTVGVIPEPPAEAHDQLTALGYGDISFRFWDGRQAWAEEAPFDAIIVTAAPTTLPPALMVQLATGGRFLVSVGRPA